MTIAKEQLKSIIERIEHLEEEKRNISYDIKEIFLEAKMNGFDIKTIKEIIKLRKKDKTELDEEQHLLDTYMMALGMIR